MATAAGLIQRLRRIRAGVRLWSWTETRTFSYGRDTRQVLDVMRPRRHAEPQPVMVVFHGGGWIEGERAWVVDRICRRYLERDFTVVNVEYRRGVAPACEDAIRALEWTFSHVDPTRVFVTGESAGAHIGLVAAFTSRRVRAAVNFYGATDLVGYLQSRSDASLRKLSPVELVTPESCPVLSIHGTADLIVPIDHASRLTRRLREVGVEAQELIVEGAGHGFTDAQLDGIYERVFRFVQP